MLIYKSGDAWKIIGLMGLIIATFAYSFMVIRGNDISAQGAKRLVLPQATQAEDETPASFELFATRTGKLPGLLTQARATPDPFRPAVLIAPSRHTSVVSPPPLPGPPQSETTVLSGPSQLRLVGLITGNEPMAILEEGDAHHMLHIGQVVADNWRLTDIDSRSVILKKGAQQERLVLGEE